MEVKIFVNYYRILDVAPSATQSAIEYRFRHLARRYHPDNRETGDRSRFDAIVEAHNTLKDAAKRARYHDAHKDHLPPLSQPQVEDCENEPLDDDLEQGADGIFLDSLGVDRDVSIQNSLLTMLYLRRRKNVREPGIGDAELERLTGCSSEHLDFHIWYLKAKGWIVTGEDGLLAITVDGVDRASALYREHANKLLTDQS